MSEEHFQLSISDTARARVSAEWSHLPQAVATRAAEALTLLEQIDDRYRVASQFHGVTDFKTATALAENVRVSEREMYDLRCEWMMAREPVMKALCDTLSLFQPPIFIPAASLAPPRGEGP